MKPVLKKNIETTDRKLKDPNDTYYKIVYITVILFFSGTFFSIYFGFKTLIPLLDLLVLVISSVMIGIAMHQFFLKSVFPMKRMEHLALAIFGVAPVLTSFFLMMNYFVILNTTIADYKVYEISHFGDKVIFKAEGLPCEEYPEFCNSDNPDIQEIRRGESLTITLGVGIIGYPVLQKVERQRNH